MCKRYYGEQRSNGNKVMLSQHKMSEVEDILQALNSVLQCVEISATVDGENGVVQQ